jgi:hypothetical protein
MAKSEPWLLYVGVSAAVVAVVCVVLIALCYIFPLHMPPSFDILS